MEDHKGAENHLQPVEEPTLEPEGDYDPLALGVAEMKAKATCVSTISNRQEYQLQQDCTAMVPSTDLPKSPYLSAHVDPDLKTGMENIT
ncbi:hypothetical protein WISP_102999 [Willisornis vidua]|uniref:Prolactin receptor n=1 Tax=Willisornis vidua TaxID=1566151 RepID=A0ABQ9D371_9PASS|nr:hypothetical protein WISP_102999 [Willisornis vidua]